MYLCCNPNSSITGLLSMREKLLLTPEEKLILLTADIQPEITVLNQMDDLIPNVSHWEAFTKMAIDRAAAPLFVEKLPQLNLTGQIPEPVLRKLKQASLRTLSRNMLLTEHFRRVIQALGHAGIPVIALKGAMLSDWLYGNINLRQFSDLDLLVPPGKGLDAVSCLKEIGYQSNYPVLSDFIATTDMVHFQPMVKNGVSVEIHIRLHSKAEDYHVNLPEMWLQAAKLQLHGVDAMGLCPEDLLLHLCIHLDKHFSNGQFQFTCMYDLVNMLNHKGDVLNWDLLEQKCILAEAESATYKYLLLAQKYMNGKLPNSVTEKYARLLTAKDERIFLRVLRGKGSSYSSARIFKEINNLSNYRERIQYLFELFYPNTAFMMTRYRLKRKSQLLLYYPYRHFTAVKYLWMAFKKTLI